MIEKVGREKLANFLVAALALPPPEKSPVYLTRYRTREMFIRLFQEVMDRFALDALVLPYRTIPPERVGEPHDPEATNQLTSHFGAPGGGGAGRLCPGQPADCHPIFRPPQRRPHGPENRPRLRTGEPAPADSHHHATAPRRAFRI
jgi:hypothetical protein